MEPCDKCGEHTDYYHVLPNGAILCDDCYVEYEIEGVMSDAEYRRDMREDR